MFRSLSGARRRQLTEAWPILIFGLGGLVFALHAMVLSGLDRTMSDWGDTRFVNYLLEHGWRWLTRQKHHESFWDPPFFYPAKGVLAYAESMFGCGPYYWIWRALGFAQDTAFQLWFLTIVFLNFLTTHLLLRKGLKLTPVASAVGAFFFAYANARINQAMHHQLQPHFYSVLCVYALFRIFGEPLPEQGTREDRWRMAWVALFFVFVSLQLYASFYLGWFLLFTLLLLGLVGLALAWQHILVALRRYWAVTLGSALIVGAATAPMVLRYLHAGKEQGMRPFAEVLSMLPPPLAWFDLGPESWMYRGWQSLFVGISMEHEQRLGVGVVTTALCLAGLFVARKNKAVQLATLTAALLVFLMTWWLPSFIPWRVVYDTVPGAGAIRSVSRLGLQLLLLASIGVGLAYEHLVSRKWQWLAVALCAFAMLEQLNLGFSFSKTLDRRDVQAIVNEIDPRKCDAFYFSPVGGRGPYWKYQNDAMIAALKANVPTLNGYSGHEPPGWDLKNLTLWSDADLQRTQAALGQWIAGNGMDASRMCWIRLRMNDGYLLSEGFVVKAPTHVRPGEKFDAEVSVRNVGLHDWKTTTRHRLGSQAPQDNDTWGMQRVELPHDVRTGEDVIFHVRATAPTTPGSYAFQWRMVQDGAGWFGPLSEPLTIEVN
ncbi:MAG: NBR1-Ig-like domain-containing protein [Myxococcaceae bacterium]